MTSILATLCILWPIRDARPSDSWEKQLRYSAVLITESGMRENITSPAGAMGPMQLMPIAIRELQVAKDVPLVCRPFGDTAKLSQTFEWGVHWGICYLEHLERLGYEGTEQLIAYNAGPSAAVDWILSGRIPLETVKYINKIESIERFCRSTP